MAETELAGLQEPAHDLAAAGARQAGLEVDLLGRHRRAEATIIDPPTGTITVPVEVVEDDWRSTV